MKLWTLLIAMLLPALFFAQEVKWEGTVLDAATGAPLPFATLRFQGEDRGTVSKVDGTFSLKFPADQGTQRVVVSAFNYGDLTVAFTQAELAAAGESLKQDVALTALVISVGSAEVTGKIDTVYAEPDMHVADFAFFSGGTLLLTFESIKHFKSEQWAGKTLYTGCKLVWLGLANEVITQRRIEPICIEFYQDYAGQVYLRTKDADLIVQPQSGMIFLHKLRKGELENYLRPIVDSVDRTLYVSTFVNDYPAFDYYAIDVRDTSRVLLHTVLDEILMEQFRSEYKWLTPRQKLEAFRAEVHYGIEKEIAGAYISGFPNSIYFEELYAPLVVSDDTVRVFDYYANHIYSYDHTHALVDSVAIDYHIGRKTGWQRSTHLDPETGDVYVLFLLEGHPELRRINLHTGKVDGVFQLTHTYAEHLNINNGFVYYTYRPFASAQTRYLYKEAMPEVLTSKKR